MIEIVKETHPDVIVIEEINKTGGRFGSRHSQKLLDNLHCMFIDAMVNENLRNKIVYVNTSDWRSKLNLSVAKTKKMAKPFLKELARLKSEFSRAKGHDKKKLKTTIDSLKKDLKDKCIHGKIDKKSISVAYVNITFNLAFNKSNNDVSDAICLCEAFEKGVKTLTNNDIFKKT
jgi:hypothetical protein